MQISQKKLSKLRSGQTVWRVLAQARDDASITATITMVHILGKKVMFRLGGADDEHSWLTPRMTCKRFGPSPDDVPHNYARFLGDLHGTACFDTRRSAEKFVRDLLAGRYPDLSERLFQSHEDNKIYDRWMLVEEFDIQNPDLDIEICVQPLV